MFVVIFEVQPRKKHFDEYLEIAKFLKPEIEKIDGFIDNERFSSQQAEGKVLSLSTWRDEKAIIRWRTLPVHHKAQEKGRQEVFADYHLRVGEVTSDTDIPRGQRLLEQRLDGTEIGKAKAATICELLPDNEDAFNDIDIAALVGLPANREHGLVDHEVFESIYNPGKVALLATWKDEKSAGAWKPRTPQHSKLRCRQVRIIRDYGMFDRREAPQYYPDAKKR